MRIKADNKYRLDANIVIDIKVVVHVVLCLLFKILQFLLRRLKVLKLELGAKEKAVATYVKDCKNTRPPQKIMSFFFAVDFVLVSRYIN